MPDDGDLFGRGLAFPPRIGADGRFALSSGAENVRDAIRVILMTEPEERVMLPQFGGGLRRFLFRPNNAATHRRIEGAITQALGRFEPRLGIESVTVEADPDDVGAALATIRYRLIASRLPAEVQLRVQLAR